MLRGRCGVVTGSLDGIGFAIASALAAQGCAIMLNDFCNEGMVEERLRSLRALGAPLPTAVPTSPSSRKWSV